MLAFSHMWLTLCVSPLSSSGGLEPPTQQLGDAHAAVGRLPRLSRVSHLQIQKVRLWLPSMQHSVTACLVFCVDGPQRGGHSHWCSSQSAGAEKTSRKWFNMRLLCLGSYLQNKLFILKMILLKSRREMEKLSLIMDMKFFPLVERGSIFQEILQLTKQSN